MTELAALRTTAFEAAYRMLGVRSDAEDVAQEAVLRAVRPLAQGEVRNAEAFVTTVATRLALDELRSARRRRERYVGPWLPEPIIKPVEDVTSVSDAVSYALLVVLETLGPAERAAFLLHDVFGYGYGEVAAALSRTQEACRQLVARARKRVAAGRPRLPVDGRAHRVLLERFLAAATTGDLDGLRAVLCDDVVLVTDGGGRARAARHPIAGRDRVARLVRKVCRWWGEADIAVVGVNGEPGFMVSRDNVVDVAGVIEVRGGRITAMHWVRNPDKLPAPDEVPGRPSSRSSELQPNPTGGGDPPAGR